MIAAATQSGMLFNTFDVALVLLLGFGFWRGRKHGMTKEFIPSFCWLFIIIIAGFGYRLLGNQLIQWGVIRKFFGRSFTESTAAYLISYIFLTGLVVVIFLYIGNHLKRRLEGSSIFGSSEYYLGIVAGVVRYACMIIFALALLHAPYYTPAEIAARKAYNNRWYGGGLKDFKGDFIPSLDEAQVAVFHESLFGPLIEKGLGLLLIDSVPNAATGKPPVMEIKQ